MGESLNGTYNEFFKGGTAMEQLVNAHVSSTTVLDSMNQENEGQTPVEQNSKGKISIKGAVSSPNHRRGREGNWECWMEAIQ